MTQDSSEDALIERIVEANKQIPAKGCEAQHAAHDQCESFTHRWQGHTNEVSYQENWLNSRHRHLELRCAIPLPVTTTGCRSAFLLLNMTADASDIES